MIKNLPIALLFAMVALPSLGQDESFRMPIYAEDEAPPAPVSADAVEALHAGADPDALTNDLGRGALKVLLVAGEKTHGPGQHDYPNWQKVWSRLLAQSGSTEVKTAWEFPSQEEADWADVMVFYQRGRWNDERAAVIDPFLARGGGLVYIHWAVDGQGGEAEFAKRTGLAAKGGGIKYRHGPMELDFTSGGGHPIARNLHRVKWYDEPYWGLTGDPSTLNLLGTSTEDDAPQPQFWTREQAGGRIFVAIPGHYAWTFDDPIYRTLLLRGIAWSGERCVDRFNELATLDARIE